MTLKELEHKKILILGYAREGRATEHFLKAHMPSAEAFHADQNDGLDYLKRQDGADLVIKTPGIPRRLVTKPFTTGTNIFHAYLAERGMRNMIIGVTGSKGKSTTSSLIAHILRESGKTVHLIGNIGAPALEALEHPIGPEDVFVMELSSYQCEDLDWSPHISVITSIFPDHLDYHGGMEAYVRAKLNIVSHAGAADYFIFNPAYAELKEAAARATPAAVEYAPTLPFSTGGAKLKGAHNLENMRGAYTVCALLNVPDDTIKNALLSFEPLPHRLTDIGTYKGITFVDDSIATAPEPTILALKTLGNVDTIFLGGADRGIDFSSLGSALREAAVRNVVLFPDTGAKIKASILEAYEPSQLPRMLETRNMEEAVRFAYEYTKPGSTCLLSTASPSFTLWKSYEEKGAEFARYVEKFGTAH